MPRVRAREQVRAAAGALIGLSLCVLIVRLAGRVTGPSLHLVAPLGATAALVFAAPNNPLAQPWSAGAGNVVSALVALLAVLAIPGPWAAGIAVAGAIAAMTLVRALHPPGGAVALLTVLHPEPALEAGLLYALAPVGVTTAALVAAAVVYNRATGRVYPFRQGEANGHAGPKLRLGLTNDDLTDLLARFNQPANLGVADLGRLLAGAEEEAARRRFDGVACGDIMTERLVTVRSDAPLEQIAKLFREKAIKSLPVTDEDGRLRGIVLQADVIAPLIARGPRWRRSPSRLSAADVMRPASGAVPHDLPVGALLNRMAAQGSSEVAPVTREGRLVGILTRSDIIRLLLRGADERIAA